MLLALVFRTVQRTLEPRGVCNVLGEERGAANYVLASQQASCRESIGWHSRLLCAPVRAVVPRRGFAEVVRQEFGEGAYPRRHQAALGHDGVDSGFGDGVVG